MASPRLHLRQRAGGRLTGGQRDDDDVATVGQDIGRANDGFNGVVASLYQDVRHDVPYEFEWSVFIKKDDRVDRLQRRENIRTFPFIADGPGWSLQSLDGRIGIHTNDERIPERARRDEQVDVTGVQKVEHAVGEHHASGPATPVRRLVGAHHFPARVEC